MSYHIRASDIPPHQLQHDYQRLLDVSRYAANRLLSCDPFWLTDEADRKIKCDRALPACTNCWQRNVPCQGYSIRLSWPRPGDKRRAVELKSTPKQKKHMLAALYQHSLFINMTSWDVDTFYKVSKAESNSKCSLFGPQASTDPLFLPS